MFGFCSRKRLKADCATVCDRGLARPENQDSLSADAARGIFAVADGMGGGAAGGVASRMVCDALAAAALAGDLDARRGAVDAAARTADGAIRAHAAAHGFAQMGSTLAAIVVDPAEPTRAAVAWAGDSRVYRRRGVRLDCLTADHRASAYSHLLTRVLGAGADSRLDWALADLMPGDTWLVCSDGVHEMLPDSTINALVARAGSAADLAARIERSVRAAGARDNYALVVVKV